MPALLNLNPNPNRNRNPNRMQRIRIKLLHGLNPLAPPRNRLRRASSFAKATADRPARQERGRYHHS